MTPANGVRTEFDKISKAASSGILALISDCLGSARSGHTPSEKMLGKHFEDAMRETNGKFLVTTYSSNIARIQQVVSGAERTDSV